MTLHDNSGRKAVDYVFELRRQVFLLRKPLRVSRYVLKVRVNDKLIDLIEAHLGEEAKHMWYVNELDKDIRGARGRRVYFKTYFLRHLKTNGLDLRARVKGGGYVR